MTAFVRALEALGGGAGMSRSNGGGAGMSRSNARSKSPERKNNFADALTTRFKLDIDRYPNVYPGKSNTYSFTHSFTNLLVYPGRYNVDHCTTSFRESPEFEHNTYIFKPSDRFKMSKEELLNSHMGPMRYNVGSSFTDRATSPSVLRSSPSSHSSSSTNSGSSVKPWNEYKLNKSFRSPNATVKKTSKFSPEAMELSEQIKIIRNLPVY